jgi:hypothetical protein
METRGLNYPDREFLEARLNHWHGEEPFEQWVVRNLDAEDHNCLKLRRRELAF